MMASNPDQPNQTSNSTMVRMAPHFSFIKKHRHDFRGYGTIEATGTASVGVSGGSVEGFAVLSQSLIDLRAVMSLTLPARRCYQSCKSTDTLHKD